ncbi:insulin-like [Heptranchias perlo]|uniref:insulin-like n=1 Tax=Heptranchias perlo TaxID=212740 RepID=UPI003559FEB4
MVLWNQIVLMAALIVFSCPKGLETLPSQHLCGSHLVEALYFVCGPKGFYYLPKVKRDMEQFLGTLGVGPYLHEMWDIQIRGSKTLRDEESIQENETEQQFPFNKPLGRMMKRGIVEHCCHNTCSLYDLEGYCNQ